MSVRAQTSVAEFVGLMALLMSLTALTIDTMLPALSQIGASLGVKNPNDSQLIITTIFMGMAFGLILFGPLSDSYGRKNAIHLGVLAFLFGSLVSLFAPDFKIMLLGRVLQGFGISSIRVSALAMIRDRFEGREMGRIMSMIMIVFIMTPALAPSAGWLILLFAHWRAIFGLFVLLGLAAMLWLHFRQPETLPPEKRRKFSLRNIRAGALETLKHPVARGYTIVSGLIFGGFVGYLSSSQQILQVQYGLGEYFSIYFGALALAIGAASFANSRLLKKYTMETLCLISLATLSVISTLFFLYAYYAAGQPDFFTFTIYLAITFFGFGILFGNFNALAIQPLGHIAGVANSVIGSVQTLLSMALGGAIGQLYDGTVLPLVLGFLLPGVAALLLTLYTRSS